MQATAFDADSANFVTPLPQRPSACASNTEGTVQGDGAHVKDAFFSSERAEVDLLVVHSATQFTIQVAELAMLVIPMLVKGCEKCKVLGRQ